MTSLCEVCSSEPFKYRCPTCGLMSCSLACTRTHKIYCAPKAPPTKTSSEATDMQPSADKANGHVASEERRTVQNGNNLTTREMSSQIKHLLERYPSLSDELRDIYKATLQEQWVETSVYVGKSRPFGRGRAAQRNRGPWTREKGFNRGLGKVRKYRERCEDGLEMGKCAEGFMHLMTLVNRGDHSQEPQ